MAPFFSPCPISWPSMPNPASLDPITAGPHVCPIPIPATLLGFSYLLWIWLSTSRGQEQFVKGSSIWHSRVLVENILPGDTSDSLQGLLGGGLTLDADSFAGVPQGLHEPSFLTHSARRRAGRRPGSARCSVWMKTSSCRTVATATPADAPLRWRAAGCPPASTSGSQESGRR